MAALVVRDRALCPVAQGYVVAEDVGEVSSFLDVRRTTPDVTVSYHESIKIQLSPPDPAKQMTENDAPCTIDSRELQRGELFALEICQHALDLVPAEYPADLTMSSRSCKTL